MLESIITGEITLKVFLLCAAASVVLGILTALVATRGARSSQSFCITVALLPLAVQMVIMLVNGNLGAGAFGLVRFRSAPGSAREIAAIFCAMALGLATGMEYPVLAALFFAVFAAVLLALTALKFGEGDGTERVLKITIPENLDYDGLFADIFEKYLRTCTLEQVKTSNLGTLFELQYRVTFRDAQPSKAFFDEVRCRNGNLNISCARMGSRDAL